MSGKRAGFFQSLDKDEREQLIRLAAAATQLPAELLNSGTNAAFIIGLCYRKIMALQMKEEVHTLGVKLGAFKDELHREVLHDPLSLGKHRVRAWHIIDQFGNAVRGLLQFAQYWDLFAHYADEFNMDVVQYLESELRSVLPSRRQRAAPAEPPDEDDELRLAPFDGGETANALHADAVQGGEAILQTVRRIVTESLNRISNHELMLEHLLTKSDDDVRKALKACQGRGPSRIRQKSDNPEKE